MIQNLWLDFCVTVKGHERNLQARNVSCHTKVWCEINAILLLIFYLICCLVFVLFL